MRYPKLILIMVVVLIAAACSNSNESSGTTNTTGPPATNAASTTAAPAPSPSIEIENGTIQFNIAIPLEGAPSTYSIEIVLVLSDEVDPSMVQASIDGAPLPIDEISVEPTVDGGVVTAAVIDLDDSPPPLGVYRANVGQTEIQFPELIDIPSGAPELLAPSSAREISTGSPDFSWAPFTSLYIDEQVPPFEYELSVELANGDASAYYHPIPPGNDSISFADPNWVGLPAQLSPGQYSVVLHSAHQVDAGIVFEHHRQATFRIIDDPCAAPDSAGAVWSLTDFEVSDLPRAVACGPEGVWVHATDPIFFNSTGPTGRTLAQAGEPRGNSDFVVFNTFNTVDVLGSDGTLTRVVDRPDADYISDAVPFDAESVLVAHKTAIGRYDIEGNELWSIPAGANAGFYAGPNAWWAGGGDGELLRIPLDGSDPVVFDTPDTIAPVAASRRDGIPVVPVEGGAWIGNGDQSIQFISDDGELGTKVNVGPLFVDDGFHFVRARNMWSAGGFVYAADNNQQVWAVPIDDPTAVAPTDRSPFAEAAGLLWFLAPGRISAEDMAGNQVFAASTQLGDVWDWEWAHGAMWLTDQFGWVVRIAAG